MRKIILAIRCLLWYGEHAYMPISPEDEHGRQLGECVRCGHKKALWFVPAIVKNAPVGKREAYAIECTVPDSDVENAKKVQECIVVETLKQEGVLSTVTTREETGVCVKTSFVVPADNFQRMFEERRRIIDAGKALNDIYCRKKKGGKNENGISSD